MLASLVPSRALCGTAVVILLLNGCSHIGSTRTATASPSNPTVVASNIHLCDVTAAGEVEKALGQQIKMFSYEHNNDPTPFYSCRVYGFSEQKIEVEHFEVKFKSTTEIDIPSLYDVHTYSEVANRPGASRFTIEGLAGEGVTIPLETNNWAAVWQYPDGSILTVLIVSNKSIGEVYNGNNIAASIAKVFAPKVPQVAAGPNQELIFYPEDAYRVPGSEDATPLTPWPSPSP